MASGTRDLALFVVLQKNISRQPFGLVYVLKGHCDYSWRINFGVSTMEHEGNSYSKVMGLNSGGTNDEQQ